MNLNKQTDTPKSEPNSKTKKNEVTRKLTSNTSPS